MVKVWVRNSLFIVFGVVLLCLPAAAFAEPLDSGVTQIDQLTEPIQKPAIQAPRLSKDIVRPDKELLVSIGHDTAVLEPNAPYEIFLDDVSLGIFNSDPNGQLFVQVKIPAAKQAGAVTLHVKGLGLEVSKEVTLVLPLAVQS